MVIRRGAVALSVTAAMMLSATILAQNQNERKQNDAQKKETQAVVKLVDGVVATGQAAPNDLGLTWVREDFLKAQGNMQYIPFTVTIDPSKVTNGTVAFYWRVVSKSPAAPEPAAGAKKDDKKDNDKKKAEYPYEDISFVPVPSGQSGPMRISRSFTVPAGAYEILLVAKEQAPEKAPKNAPAPKLSVIRQAVNVPDFWNGEFATSTIILAQRIDPLPAPLTSAQLADRPYALGAMEIAPMLDTKMSKKSELSTFMLIYNPKTDSANKPDVTVEYNFYAKEGGAEKFFNKTNPQALNKETLPPAFDMAQGHQLQSGQAVPLASFPEGEYRLEIKVTDKIANKTVTKDINFTVNPS